MRSNDKAKARFDDSVMLAVSLSYAYARLFKRLKVLLGRVDPTKMDAVFVKRVVQDQVRTMMVEIGLDSKKVVELMLVDGMARSGVLNPVIDPHMLDLLYQNSPVWKAYARMNDQLIRDVNDVITRTFTLPDRNVDRLSREISDVAQVSERRARTIARTETQAVQNTGRVLGYRVVDPEGRYRYKWGGSTISTTCDACKWVQKNTPEGGVRLDDLNLLVKEACNRWYPHLIYRDFQCHPNCRHFPQVERIVTDRGVEL